MIQILSLSSVVYLGIFISSIWGVKIGVVIITFAFLVYLKNNKLSKKQILEKLQPLKSWIFANIGIFSIGLVSLFFCFDVLQTSKAIIFFLIFPFFISCITFILFSNMETKNFNAIILIFTLHSLFTIGVYIFTSDTRAIGLGNHSIVPYAFFLLISFALSLAILMYTKFKTIAIVLLIASLFALYCNGTRASIFSVIIMLILAFLYPQYKHKKIIATSFLVLIVICTFIFIKWSENLSPRYNFYQMIKSLPNVWAYSPAEMKKFDARYTDILGSNQESKNSSASNPIFESNALQRLALYKSALNTIQDDPLTPRGYYSRFWSSNLPTNMDSSNIPYLLTPQHTHIHNEILSSFFELGLIGGVLYLVTFLIPMIWSLRHRNIYGFLLFTITSSAFAMSLFDSIFSFTSIKIVFYALIGILFAYSLGEKNENPL